MVCSPSRLEVTMSHTARLPFFSLAPASLHAMINLSKSVKQSSLGERLFELVNLRVSQVNGCGVCVDMHWNSLMASPPSAVGMS